MTIAEGDSTVLVLSGVGVPDYSARGLTQTLDPIGASSQVRRTINGSLIDLSYDQFRKYQSTISAQDMDPPAVDGVWPGHIVSIECVAELCYSHALSGNGPNRPMVYGSERISGDFTFYRPLLDMMVTSFTVSVDEYGAAVSWQMQLEEV
jgi:hypothetical protein